MGSGERPSEGRSLKSVLRVLRKAVEATFLGAWRMCGVFLFVSGWGSCGRGEVVWRCGVARRLFLKARVGFEPVVFGARRAL